MYHVPGSLDGLSREPETPRPPFPFFIFLPGAIVEAELIIVIAITTFEGTGLWQVALLMQKGQEAASVCIGGCPCVGRLYFCLWHMLRACA